MTARTSARDVACPTCGIDAGLPCRSVTTGRSNTDTHKARHDAAAALHADHGPLFGELCAGYGGIGMGAQTVLGGRMLWYAEWDDDPSRIMAHHHPDAVNYRDVTAIDWHNVPRVDVLTAGFPCQPFSHAGKRLGANDERHLWPHIARGIAIMRPSLVILENVRGLASGQGEPDTDEIVALDARRQHIDRALVVIERRRRKAIRENATQYVRRHTDDSHRLMVERRRVVARAKRARAELARALATVLGDLAHIGYDAQWYGLRAADVGAPHGRFRFFIYAWPADAPSDPRWVGYGDARVAAAYADHAGRVEHSGPVAVRAEQPAAERSRDDAPDDLTLLPTPNASDTSKHAGQPLEKRQGHALRIADVIEHGLPPVPEVLLPTPAVNDMGAAYTPDEWDDWTARQKAKHRNGNGHGKSLEIEAQRLLPTPRTTDANTPGVHGQGGQDLRTEIALLKTPTAQLAVNGGSQHPDKRKGGGHGPTLADEVEHLLPTPRASDGEKGGPNQRGSSGDLMLPSAVLFPTPVTSDREGARRRHRDGTPYGSAQHMGQTLTDATTLLPTPSAADAGGGHLSRSGDRGDELLLPGVAKSLADGPRLLPTPQTVDGATGHFETPASERRADGHQVGLSHIGADSGQDWGEYGPAVRRWEAVIGRPAPSPTEIGPKGSPRLSPAFVEWMMGLPAGHVTDPAIWDDGRSDSNARNAQLKALGNGVVPPQCAAATWAFVQDMHAEHATKAASA